MTYLFKIICEKDLPWRSAETIAEILKRSAEPFGIKRDDIGARYVEKNKAWFLLRDRKKEGEFLAVLFMVLRSNGNSVLKIFRYDPIDGSLALMFQRGSHKFLTRKILLIPAKNIVRIRTITPIRTINLRRTLNPEYWVNTYLKDRDKPVFQPLRYNLSFKHDGSCWQVRGSMIVRTKGDPINVGFVLRHMYVLGLGLDTDLGYGFLQINVFEKT
ncbi:MAG: hypothetical protein ACTSXX_05805 [Candidatus Baldrarchaeia archaeon]